MIYLLFAIYILVYVVLSRITDKIADDYYSSRIRSGKVVPKVYDILHRHMPEWHEYNTVHDMITFGMVLPMFVYPRIFQRYLRLLLIVFLIRTVTINMTILPKYKGCVVKQYSSVLRTCYDKIFSGHFAWVFLAALLYVENGIVSIYTAISMVMVVAAGAIVTRDHYTIDLFVSLLVCTLVYQNFS
ncbi:hypothetical protein EB118_08990 [bacterium]|nr:hypothetical protein [bacterium]NDC94461.1 hypothetical protein [bacterium]NDD84434.1 hypothetical protein [bacterium]NDG30196.1 hypothetical protein [bacterium]